MVGIVIIVIAICITIYEINNSKHKSEVDQVFWSNGKVDPSKAKKTNDKISSLINRVETLENKMRKLENNYNNIV